MPLPNFIVIGAAKSGTTSLHRYLGEHPEIFAPARGEPSFFAHEGQQLNYKGPGDDDWSFVTDIAKYRSLFDGAEGYAAVGEVSPRYLYFERSCERIKHHVPDARLVAILRHPVGRAYSHFLMNRDRRCEPEPDFRKAIEKEEERASLGWGWDWRYVRAGLYYEQLQRYYRLFDGGKIKVFLYDDFINEPDKFFGDLFDFLGVDPSFRPDTTVRHRKASLPRIPMLRTFLGRPNAVKSLAARVIPRAVFKGVKARVTSWNRVRPDPLSQVIRQEVFERYFEDDCNRLEGLIGRDLSQWSRAVAHGNHIT